MTTTERDTEERRYRASTMASLMALVEAVPPPSAFHGWPVDRTRSVEVSTRSAEAVKRAGLFSILPMRIDEVDPWSQLP